MDERRIELERRRWRGIPDDFALRAFWRTSAAGNLYAKVKGRIVVVHESRLLQPQRRWYFAYLLDPSRGEWYSSELYRSLDDCKLAALAHLGVAVKPSSEPPPTPAAGAVPPHYLQSGRKIEL